jgi:hypothetical protein
MMGDPAACQSFVPFTRFPLEEAAQAPTVWDGPAGAFVMNES